MDGTTLRDYATQAIRFWEPRRAIYNLVLAVVVVLVFCSSSHHSPVTIDTALFLFLLAVLANVAYCAAYVVDVFVQASAFRDQWNRFRWPLFALGTAFAAVTARYFALGLFDIYIH